VGPAGVAETVWEIGKCSCSGAVSHDGLGAGSHAMTLGDVEFELEANPDSKSASWL
jgi:hypothetical protein